MVSRVLGYLDAKGLFAVAAVCSTLRASARVQWGDRVRGGMEQHVRDANNFLKVLGRVSGIISGSSALDIVLTGSRKVLNHDWAIKKDLDVYVPNRDSYNTIREYLQAMDEYHEVTIPQPDEERYWENRAHIAFIIRLRSPLFESHVDIICAQENCETLPLASFWSTLVMNYVSASSVVILYPRLTLDGSGLTNPGADVNKVAACQKKYEGRGFNLMTVRHDAKGCANVDHYCPSVLRYTEDVQSACVSWNDVPRDAQSLSPSFNRGLPFSARPCFWRWSTCPITSGGSMKGGSGPL